MASCNGDNVPDCNKSAKACAQLGGIVSFCAMPKIPIGGNL